MSSSLSASSGAKNGSVNPTSLVPSVGFPSIELKAVDTALLMLLLSGSLSSCLFTCITRESLVVSKLCERERLQDCCVGAPPAFRGILRVKVDPAPSKLFNSITPCISSASCLQMLRPKPVIQD